MSEDLIARLRTPTLTKERMLVWDTWRKAIANGSKASWPRDGFEALLDAIDEDRIEAANRIDALQRLSADRAGVIEALQRALTAVEYEPGDHPVVPTKHARFVEAIRALASDASGPVKREGDE